MTGKELRDYLPLMPIEDAECSCVMSKRGDVTFGWRIYLPVAFTVNEAGYDSIIESFIQAYKLLPPWCIVHKQDIFRFDRYKAKPVGEFLADSYERHFDGRRYLNGYCYLFLTFSSKSVIEMKSESSGAFGFFSCKPPKEETLRGWAGIAEQFESVLSNNPLLSIVPLKAKDFVGMGDSGEDTGIIPEYLKLFTDTPNLSYDLEFEDSYMMYGENVIKAWYVQDSDAYPAQVKSVCPVGAMTTGVSDVFLSGGSPFGYSLKIPHIVNRYIVTLPRKTVEYELNQKKRLMNSFSLYSAPCRVNAEELDAYLENSARDSAITVKCFTDVIAWGKPSEMSDVRNRIVTAFSELDITVTEDMRAMPVLFYAGIPGAAAELGYDYYMTSEMNGFLCHGVWDGYDFGIRGGVVRVCDRKRMMPMAIDFQSAAREGRYVDNLNAVIIGPSGSGKSFLMNSLITNFYNSGQHTLVIDVGDSYELQFGVIREETGGKAGLYNSYDPDNPLSFNPFKGRSEWGKVDEDGDRISSGMDYVMSLIQSMYEPAEGWSKDMSSVLEKLLNHFFTLWDEGYGKQLEDDLLEAFVNARRARAEKTKKAFSEKSAAAAWINPLPEIFSEEKKAGDPIFDDFYRYVTRVAGPLIKDDNFIINGNPVRPDMIDVDKFVTAMEKFAVDGVYGFLLNAKEEKDFFSSPLICYEVDQIKDNKDLFPLWILSIIHSFEEKMRNLMCPKVIVIEEAWSAIAKPTMASFLVWLFRTARKFKTSAIVVTQSVADLTGSAVIKDAILQNSSTRILLDQSKNVNKFEESAELLALNPMDVSLVLSVNRQLDPNYHYKEGFFAIGPAYSNVFAIEVSPEQAVAYESDKTLKGPTLDLVKKNGGSYIGAIKEIVAARKKKN